MKINFSKKKIILAAHESVRIGPVYDFLEFLFEKKVSSILLIEHPLLYLKEAYSNSSYLEYFKNGKLHKKNFAFHWNLPESFLYVKDFLYTIIWTYKTNEEYDLYIGFNPLNAFAGIVLKKLGKVNKVVYYSIDYFTNRFENKVLNKIYHAFDKFCVYYSDETWNVSGKMIEARENYNNISSKIPNKQFVVPIGVWTRKIPKKKFNEINKKKIIFIGVLIPLMGVDTLLKAMPSVIKKIPDVKLEIIGDGQEKAKLVLLAKKLNILRNVDFLGWVINKKDKWEKLSLGALGLAPFNSRLFNEEVKNADPAKVKEYLAVGMPVVGSDVIRNSIDLEKNECGILTRFNANDLAKGIIDLLLDVNKLKSYRNNAIKYMEKFDFEKIAQNNLERILEKNA